MVPDNGCGREVLGRASLRVSFKIILVLFNRECGWKVSRRMFLGLLLGVSMVVIDRGMGWEVLRRVLGCPWRCPLWWFPYVIISTNQPLL